MHLSTAVQAALLCLTPLASAAKLTVAIPATPLLSNPAALPPSTHATLIGASGQHHDARLTRSNTLVFKNLTPDTYLLDIHSRDHIFPSCRVDVSLTTPGSDDSAAAEGAAQELIQVWQTFMGNEWSNLGPSFGEQTGELVVTIQAMGRKDYYQQREGFNILGLLKSPMILMGLFSVAMVFGMPYLMENMDGETKAEFEEMQKKSPITGSQGAAAQIQNFDLASWMAGQSSDTGKASGAKSKAK